MGIWEEKRLGEIAPFKYGKSLVAEKRQYGKYKVFSSAGICGVSDSYLAEKGIIIGRKGSIGKVHYSKEPFYCIDTAFYIDVIDNNCNLKFIFYYLPLLQLDKLNTDAAVPGLNRNVAEKLKLKIPDLKTQEKIADILSSYDDLIENNNRRIAILEQTAQELYKEWFVRFRFPGHEQTSFENGIPKGWEVVKLGNFVDIVGGKRLPKDKQLISEKTLHPYIRIRDISNLKFISLTNDFEYIDDETYQMIKRFTVSFGDIIISIVGTIGSVACIGKSLHGANLTENCIKLIKINELSSDYIYHFLNSDYGQGVIKASIVGATQPKLPIYNIKKIKLLKPDKKILDSFSEELSLINKKLIILQEQNQNVIKQRDLLLPRLMSGKLEV